MRVEQGEERGCVEPTVRLGCPGGGRFGLSGSRQAWCQGPGSGARAARDSAAEVSRAPARPVGAVGAPPVCSPGCPLASPEVLEGPWDPFIYSPLA